ncbi:hypothetical protein Salat_0196800 [Sesamum alatum]|uniref:Uncharacterized protein n=1 Tax=Sesamum alatum TaxID=300844 RepID=A0AAE1YZ53_9LAMI|nr:hypothetical protein Salat_0196800 [Sesamum alatum]
MGLHSLRDRRLLTLFIKEKDDQILSLHLLLQKEREQVQEVKRTCEEMKMKIHNLRAQKTELNGRLSEMQSTISSLREEQRTIELAYQEKQSEAKFLKDRYIVAKDQNPQVKALTEILQQKEAEIEDLNHRVQLPANVGSVMVDEASIVSGNGTTVNQNEDIREDVHDEGKSVESSTQNEAERGNSEERTAENGRTDVDKSDQVGLKDGNDKSSEITKTENLGNDQEEDSEVDLTKSKQLANVGDADSRRMSKSDFSDVNEELGVREGGVKLELHENSHGRQFRHRGKHSELRRAKGKRKYGSSGAISSQIGNKFEKGQPRNGDKVHNESVYTEENNGGNDEESRSGIKLQNRIKPVGAEDMSGKVAKLDVSNQVKNEREVITERSENKNDVKQDSSTPGRREDVEPNEDRDENQIGHVETEGGMESAQHSGEDGENKEETDEPDF